MNTITTELTSDQITDKRGYAKRWKFSVRHVDNLLKRGLPHLKIGERRVRILTGDADKWMIETYHASRNPTPTDVPSSET